MSLVTLKEVLRESVERRYAVGAFDTASYQNTAAILKAAEQTGTPMILMVTWGMIEEQEKPGEYVKLTLEMIRNAGVPVALHLDHGGSFEDCMKAIHAGFSGVMFDGSSLPMEENIRITKKVTEAAHACGVSVEAEIGHVGGAEGGALLKDGAVADSANFTTPEEAVRFVEATGVDALAVAIGTVHGIYRGTPKLDLKRLSDIRSQVDIPLVMHGGSGLTPEAFRGAGEHGINKINFFTGMSLAAAGAVKETVAKAGDRPIHMQEIQEAADQAVTKIVREHIEIFQTQPLIGC